MIEIDDGDSDAGSDITGDECADAATDANALEQKMELLKKQIAELETSKVPTEAIEPLRKHLKSLEVNARTGAMSSHADLAAKIRQRAKNYENAQANREKKIARLKEIV